MQSHPALYIAQTDHKGKGVFTASSIPLGSIIEICNVIVIPQDQKIIIHNTVLHDYYFDWHPKGKGAGIALGNGSLYNHADLANADYEMNYADETITFHAIRDLDPGEEITISYTNSKLKGENLWFEPL